MLLASVKPGSSPASEATIASAVHLSIRAAAAGEGSPHSSASNSIRRPSTTALIITRRYACAESKPSCFALAVNFLRVAGSNGMWIVDVSVIILIGYQRGIIMSMDQNGKMARRRKNGCHQERLKPKITEAHTNRNAEDAQYCISASLLTILAPLTHFVSNTCWGG
jgi:hypothetical protein